MKRSSEILIVITIFLLLPAGVNGQSYRAELGVLGGSSFYMGDANSDVLFLNEHASYGLLARYNLNGRFALKASTFLARISGTTQGESSAFMNGAEIGFDRRVLDASVQLEACFYNYGAPDYQSGSSRVAPYILLGLGFSGYEADRRKICANIPFGLGIKVKILPRVNLGCEWTFRETFADDLDYAVSATGFQLQDSWVETGSWNKNKDWYSILMIYVSYDLYSIGSKCFK